MDSPQSTTGVLQAGRSTPRCSSKSARAIPISDPNTLMSPAVLSSPKPTDSEVENFARAANVSEEILRTIGMKRGSIPNDGVVAAFTTTKTPLAVAGHEGK